MDYEELGLVPIINAAGRMSKLGVSIIDDSILEVMRNGAQNYVNMDELMIKAGKTIAKEIGCADVCICASASSAIVLAIASLLCTDKRNKVKHFHQTVQLTNEREIILLKGHNINYGAPIDEMIYLGGGIPVEVGYANECYIEDIASAITPNTKAILYVKSHHCVQKNMVGVEAVITLANERNIPCIVDASAEENLSIYHELGADIVCYAGTKAISGPTSGFAACKSEQLANHMRLQYQGIGRAMKVGKESVLGLVKAVSMYQQRHGYVSAITSVNFHHFIEQMNAIKGMEAALINDESGRAIQRCRLHIHAPFPLTAFEVVVQLKRHIPAIYTRDYQANLGYIEIDPRGLKNVEELQTIYDVFAGMQEYKKR